MTRRGDDMPLSLSELAKELRSRGYKVSRQTLHRMALGGSLPAKKAGIIRSTVRCYLDAISPDPVPQR